MPQSKAVSRAYAIRANKLKELEAVCKTIQSSIDSLDDLKHQENIGKISKDIYYYKSKQIKLFISRKIKISKSLKADVQHLNRSFGLK